MSTILVVDDEQGIRAVLRDVLQDEGHRVLVAEDGIQGLQVLAGEQVNLVILDVWLPNMGGIDVLREIKKEYPDIEVVVISGHANIKVAVQAVKMGAFDFLEKPLSLDKTITVVANALKFENLRKENRSLKDSLFIEDEMIGSSPEMEKVRSLIDQSAKSDSRILILGENGTGKELVAKEIHRRSHRANGPFVEVNCASIPETLIESELFGHEKGAFTNAISRRKGKFELADNGTLFLDEIADMSPATQAKVLRVIQELRFERIGAEESIAVNVRLIAATNKDIEKEIEEGRFREDLYFRVNVIPIFVPPLRDRISDLAPLLTYFMRKFKRDSEAEPRKISKSARTLLRGYLWPGNIRELKNFVERVNIMTEERTISSESVQRYLTFKPVRGNHRLLSRFDDMKLNDAKNAFEKEFLTKKLGENYGNITRTSEILGITPSNLHNKIKKYGIELKK
jgi:two-component system nitrogen regulation response regulator NtrX